MDCIHFALLRYVIGPEFYPPSRARTIKTSENLENAAIWRNASIKLKPKHSLPGQPTRIWLSSLPGGWEFEHCLSYNNYKVFPA